MKEVITSSVLDFLGNRLVGSASSMFGLPSGAFSDLYLMHYDRALPRPEDPNDPAWMRRRAFEIYIRHQLSVRVGILATLLAVAIVIAGLIFLGGTMGVRHAWASHEAQAAQATAQEHQVDSMVGIYAQQCQSYVGQKLLPIMKQSAAQMGCDPATGKLDQDTARAWAKKQMGGN